MARQNLEATLADGLFLNLFPTVDNLRNFSVTPTREMLDFFEQLRGEI